MEKICNSNVPGENFDRTNFGMDGSGLGRSGSSERCTLVIGNPEEAPEATGGRTQVRPRSHRQANRKRVCPSTTAHCGGMKKTVSSVLPRQRRRSGRTSSPRRRPCLWSASPASRPSRSGTLRCVSDLVLRSLNSEWRLLQAISLIFDVPNGFPAPTPQ